ncbi:MAG: hypothetical protein OPY06_05510 [Nitrosopumilus sp.]|nr:hypothetical protein [Nitrosopumilus sp.]MDF2423434.1 hypothetical protein [Nitrosopumilus sp.]MDF2424028.1 hypothetical protein [Nitrosopumilus sp.]MDF2427371.1 hypothetical protein [Nitrosopumilus sp.]MDF2428570.1 hypothetical protein [Nitrosopumilus sp.]
MLNKIPYLRIILFISVFTTSTFFIHNAFGLVTEGCGMWDVKLECDLSGWMKLFMGDIGVGAVLAVLLHILSHRNKVKLEENSIELRKNSENIRKIIESQDVMRKRRQEFAVQTLRNHFTTLLFIFGVVNRFVSKYNEGESDNNKLYDKIKSEESRIERIVQNIRNTLMYSNDTLDPTFVNQVDTFCTFTHNLLKEENDKILMPKYDEGKKKILELTEKLKEFDSSNEIFR